MYSDNLTLECPYCSAKCQFVKIDKGHTYCAIEGVHHIAYVCMFCNGIIVTEWSSLSQSVSDFERIPSGYNQHIRKYYPVAGNWKPRVNLSLIADESVRSDFIESMNCYDNGFYNACMVMARRAIQQEVINKKAAGDNLYKQIEAMGISPKLKTLLQKVKNFGNNGAHPDFCLFDDSGIKVEDKKEFAKLSLEFLDRYFADEYEIDSLVSKAPKSQLELAK